MLIIDHASRDHSIINTQPQTMGLDCLSQHEGLPGNSESMASAAVSGDFLQYNSARQHVESSISARGSREKENGMEMKIYLDGYLSGH